MPTYMDRHDFSGVTAKDVAAAHQEDLKIQDAYGCRGLTYWFDEERQMAFCLIEAPDKESVKNMHEHAHGMVPYEIIEVESHVVKAFLGRIEHPHDADDIVVDESAFRTIMSAELKDTAILLSKIGQAEAHQLSGIYHDTIRKALKAYDGKEVEHSRNGFLVTFVSASKAVDCALDILKSFKHDHKQQSTKNIGIQIGLSAGTPVDDDDHLFGHAIQLANRLRKISFGDQLTVSSMVRELANDVRSADLEKKGMIRTLSLSEERFLNQLFNITEVVWHDSGFTVLDFARNLGISKSQLYRKTIVLTGYSPNDFLKEFRLNKAVQLIENQDGNISEIAYQAGFTCPSYFSKCFQKRFSILPSAYATAVARNLCFS